MLNKNKELQGNTSSCEYNINRTNISLKHIGPMTPITSTMYFYDGVFSDNFFFCKFNKSIIFFPATVKKFPL